MCIKLFTDYLAIIITGGEQLELNIYNKYTSAFIRRYKTPSVETYWFLRKLEFFIEESTKEAKEQLTDLKYKDLLNKFNKIE